MVAVAIYSADSAFRLRLEQLLRAELGYTIASVTNDPAAVATWRRYGGGACAVARTAH
jgi:hypothetical protein